MLSENSDGVHLHLEIFENGKLVNPLSYLEIESNK
jgi:murein DD-endopeptidase MepM/ murein hydrolase activator NlpD